MTRFHNKKNHLPVRDKAAIPRGQHAPRVLFPAPPPETRPEPVDGLNPCLDAVQTLNPAAGQRGRSPGHAAARVLPVGFAADLPTTCRYTEFTQHTRF